MKNTHQKTNSIGKQPILVPNTNTVEYLMKIFYECNDINIEELVRCIKAAKKNTNSNNQNSNN